MDGNKSVREEIVKFNLPLTRYMTIKNEVGDDMNAKIMVPPGFKSDGSIAYPVLMQVYGGPNSVKVYLINVLANGKSRIWI
jgi:dipeptidyl aminopeptidase/acylaminoacyl peptidase